MYTLPKLDYPYDALEPFIDKQTLLIHHTKHHQAYINNLNDAIANYPDLQSKDIGSILEEPDKIPEDVRAKVMNNGGGFLNHNLYWNILSPNKSAPEGEFMETLEKTFGSFDSFKEKLESVSLSQFGSGWGWLVLDSGKLDIISSQNQNTPLSSGKLPLLGIDVWEHAYYLKYQNRRADYLKAIWNVVNWNYVSSLFLQSIKNP